MLIYQRFRHYRKVFKIQKMPQAGIPNLDITGFELYFVVSLS